MSNMSQELSRKSKVNYQNGKIYIVRNSVNDLTYIGSVCQSLSQRMAQHRVDTKKNKMNHMKLHKLMNELNVENFYIELMEYYPCNTREELFKKEGECIRQHKPMLNSKIQGRTDKEYREDIRDELLMKKKKHYEQNREHYIQKAKENYEANKEHIDAKRRERYDKKKDEIIAKEIKRYNEKKDEINERRRATMKQRKEEDDNFRKELNRKNREWYAKNKEKQCQRRKELRQTKEQQEQPEQEPE